MLNDARWTLLKCLPDVSSRVIADLGYTSHAFCEHIWGAWELDRQSHPSSLNQRASARCRSQLARDLTNPSVNTTSLGEAMQWTCLTAIKAEIWSPAHSSHGV